MLDTIVEERESCSLRSDIRDAAALLVDEA